MDKLLQYDTELFLYLNNLGTSHWDGLWLLITNKLVFGPVLGLVILGLLYKHLGIRGVALSVVVVALMITFTDQATNLFKDGFQRLRPCRMPGVLEYTRFIAVRCGHYGFFSGHASNSMAVAILGGLLLRPFYRKIIYVLITISLIVAYSRIYVGVHYPLDVLCGLIFGVFSGIIFHKLAQLLMKRFHIAPFLT